MANLRLDLDTRTKKNGMCPIRLRINSAGTSAYVATGVSVEEQYFIDGSLYDCIHRKAFMSVEKRNKVARIVRQFEEFMTEMDESEMAKMTAREIKERVCGGVQVRTRTQAKKAATPSADFMAFFDEFGKSRNTPKTVKSYEYAWGVLFDYLKARYLRTLTFGDIDYARLVDISGWLKSKNLGPSTRHMIESYIRAAYRDGQKRHIVGRENDPYFDYSIARVPLKDIECLSAEEMKKVMEFDLSAWSGLERARDIAMMSFYLCGANLMDLYSMNKPKDGKVVFVRHKVERASQRDIHIRVEPELEELLKKHGGRQRLLACAESASNYETLQRRVNRLLKQAGAKIGVDVTLAKIRRTWATIAAEIGCPDYIINKSMGHLDSTVNKKFYERYDWGHTEKWNRRIIDYIKRTDISIQNGVKIHENLHISE